MSNKKVKFNARKTMSASVVALAAAGIIVFSDATIIVSADDDVTVQTQSSQAVSQSEVNAQEEVVNEASENVSDAQEAVEDAEALNNEATEENIAATEEEISEQETIIEETEESITQQEELIVEKEAEIAPVEDELAAANQDVTDQEAVVNEAEQNVADAEQAIEESSDAALLEEKTQAENDLTAAEEELESVKNAIAVQTASQEEAEAEQVALETEQANLENTIGQAEDVIAGAEAEIADQNSQLENLTTSEADLERQLQAIENNYITVSEEYVQALTDYYNEWLTHQENGTIPDYDSMNAYMDEISEEALEGNNNVFFNNELLQERNNLYAQAVDPNIPEVTMEDYNAYVQENIYSQNYTNLFIDSEADRNIFIETSDDYLQYEDELSNFAVSLLNPIREQFGTPTYIVTEGGLNFARNVAEEYDLSGFDMLSDENLAAGDYHDEVAINNAAENYGLLSDDDRYQYYENISGGFIRPDYYLEQPDGTITNMLTLNDVKEGIYYTIVGMFFDDSHVNQGHAISLAGFYNDLPNSYVGLSVDQNDQIHIITVEQPGTIVDETVFNEKFSLAPSTLYDELSTYGNADSIIAEAQNSIDAQQAIVDENQTLLNTVNSDLTANAELQMSIADALVTLNDQQTTLTQTIEDLNTLIADLEQQIAESNNEGNQELYDNLQTARAALTSAQEELTRLQNIASDIEVNDLNPLLEELATLQAELVDLQNVLSQENDALTAATSRLNAYLGAADALALANQNLADAEAVLTEEQALLDYLIANLIIDFPEVEEEQVTEDIQITQPKTEVALPETGVTSIWSTVAAGISTILLGIGLIKPKKEND